MKTATIRQVRHELTEVLKWIAAGEEVTVLNRNRPVARLLPPLPEAGETIEMPDFEARARAIFGDKRTQFSDIVIEEREESRW